MEHRFVTCLYADIRGYSRLIAADLEGTVRRLTSCQAMMLRVVANHGGRVVDLVGDSLLAEFPAVAGAVRCAVELQRQLGARNAGLPPQHRIEFRIGIEIGEVLVAGGRLFGECVNVAARVQEVAAPGGICLSGSAFDRIDGALPCPFEYLGERAVKNIERPLRIYQVSGG